MLPMHYNLTLCLGLLSLTITVKQDFLNKCVQSHLKVAYGIAVKGWEVLDPIYRVLYLRKRDIRNLEDYHMRQSSNVKLFDAQRRREAAEPVQFLEQRKQRLTVAETQGSDQRV
jgi:hypothetical protein